MPIQKDFITIADIRGQSLVYQRDGSNAEIVAFLSEHGITPKAICLVEDDLSLIAMVEAGYGLALMPKLALERIRLNAKVYPIHPTSYRNIGLATLRGVPLSMAAAAMHQHILECCRTLHIPSIVPAYIP